MKWLFYLRMHIQCQPPLVSDYQADDALQYGPQEGVDAKHQSTQLLAERWSYLETMETEENRCWNKNGHVSSTGSFFFKILTWRWAPGTGRRIWRGRRQGSRSRCCLWCPWAAADRPAPPWWPRWPAGTRRSSGSSRSPPRKTSSHLEKDATATSDSAALYSWAAENKSYPGGLG